MLYVPGEGIIYENRAVREKEDVTVLWLNNICNKFKSLYVDAVPLLFFIDFTLVDLDRV